MNWLGLPPVGSYEGLELSTSTLPLNHAYIIANTSIYSVTIYEATDDCFPCPYRVKTQLYGSEKKPSNWQVDTSVQRSWQIFGHTYEQNPSLDSNYYKGGLLCEMRPTIEEYGVYRLDVGKCVVQPVVQPVNTYLPLLLTILLLLGGFMLYKTIAYIIQRHKQRRLLRQDKVLEITVNHNDEENYSAVNTLRGILLVLIIFMTTGGGGYSIFNNTRGGLSVAECLFFGYVWSIGVFIPKVMDEALLIQTKCAIMKSICTRAFFLIALGFVIDSTLQYMTPSPYVMSLWCPLQRLGVAYLVAASAYALTVRTFQTKSKSTIYKAVGNMVSLVWCWILAAFLLAIIVILIKTQLSFNCLGDITMFNHLDVAKALRDDSENCNNGITEYINRLFVAKSKTVIDVNGYVGFSQGILGVLSTILYTMFGMTTGIVYQNSSSHSTRLKLWGIWATVFGVAGLVLAIVSYPINFNLWPIASIFLLTSASTYVFMVIYSTVEVSNATSSVLNTFGVTSLPILCGHLLFSYSLPFRWEIYIRTHIVYLLQNYWIIALWLVLSFMLNKKKIMIKM